MAECPRNSRRNDDALRTLCWHVPPPPLIHRLHCESVNHVHLIEKINFKRFMINYVVRTANTSRGRSDQIEFSKAVDTRAFSMENP